MGADQSNDWHATIASALDWWREAGVDVELQDSPRDWLNATVPAPQARVTAEKILAPVAAAPLPATLEAFATWRIGPDAPEIGWGVPLRAAEGPVTSDLMVLIDLPEREDAAEGRLLGGACGRLFDRMLAAIGRSRDDIHLASIAAARPIAGRIAPDTAARLAEIARHYVTLVAPKRLLLLGNGPSRVMLELECPQARGSLRPLNHTGATVAVASFHPALLLERPQMKAEAWKDLQLLIEAPGR